LQTFTAIKIARILRAKFENKSFLTKNKSLVKIPSKPHTGTNNGLAATSNRPSVVTCKL